MREPGGPESGGHSDIRVSGAGFQAGAVPGAHGSDKRQCLKISAGPAGGCGIRGLGGFKLGAKSRRRPTSLARCASHHHQIPAAPLGSERLNDADAVWI